MATELWVLKHQNIKVLCVVHRKRAYRGSNAGWRYRKAPQNHILHNATTEVFVSDSRRTTNKQKKRNNNDLRTSTHENTTKHTSANKQRVETVPQAVLVCSSDKANRSPRLQKKRSFSNPLTATNSSLKITMQEIGCAVTAAQTRLYAHGDGKE